jgi:hypothetical protein
VEARGNLRQKSSACAIKCALRPQVGGSGSARLIHCQHSKPRLTWPICAAQRAERRQGSFWQMTPPSAPCITCSQSEPLALFLGFLPSCEKIGRHRLGPKYFSAQGKSAPAARCFFHGWSRCLTAGGEILTKAANLIRLDSIIRGTSFSAKSTSPALLGPKTNQVPSLPEDLRRLVDEAVVERFCVFNLGLLGFEGVAP